MSKPYSAGISKVDSRFSRVVDSRIKKSRFNRDQVHKTTFNAGKLVPIFIDEILPGDHYKVDLSFVIRQQANITCPLDDVEADFYFFFVPRRLTWIKWQRFMGENDGSTWALNSPPPLPPQMLTGSNAANALVQKEKMIGDYYGIPPGTEYPKANVLGIQNSLSSEPFRGYALIWNRWFRDQNYQAPLNVFLDTSDTPTSDNDEPYYPNSPLLYVNKKHDYFTSVLPQTLKPVQAAAATYAPVPDILLNRAGQTAGPPSSAANLWLDINRVSPTGASLPGQNYIQQLRTAWQLTKLLEREGRGGTRYVELIKSHFNVDAQDYRLQYPEFLGHYHSYIHKQQVAQTSSTDGTSPQANISAFSITSNRGSVFSKSFVEHGFIHGFVVLRQRKTYQQGIERFWFKQNKFDFYFPELANITEQAVLQREIYPVGPTISSPTFGFQEAWAEYRFKPNRVSAEFRTGATNSLDVWHYGDYYSSAPVASAAFMQDNSDVNIMRTLAVQDQHQFFADIKIHCLATRPMPTYSIPGFVDHF